MSDIVEKLRGFAAKGAGVAVLIDAATEIESLRAKLREADAQVEKASWRDISTAPKDGTSMHLCFWQHGQDTLPVVTGFWSRLSEVWWDETGGRKVKPTHWMPLQTRGLAHPSTERADG